MKSTITKLIALILALTSVFALASCGDNYTTYYYDSLTGQWSDKQPSGSGNNNSGNGGGYNEGGSNNGGSYDDGNLNVEISDIQQTIRYVDDDQMIIPVANNELSIDKSYTLELKFTITPSKNSDGYSYFSTVLTFTDISILNGTIKEAETGKQIEQKVIDAATGAERKDISLSFRIPAEKDTEKQITIVVGLEPVKVAPNSQMLVDFNSEDAKITGSDGISRSFSIGAATLKAPTLTVDSANKQITWKHVKNATYYLVFADSQMTGYVIQAGNEAPGADMVLDLFNYTDLIGRNVTIQACSDLEYFSPSAKSNAVIVW